MHIVGINGSPRKTWNTAKLLRSALDGAESQGAATELIHLYDLDYQGCISCFACKLRSGKSYGHCVVNDELKSILQKLENADAIILGSPIYYGMVTGEMRSFIERLLFPYLVYDSQYSSLRRKPIPAGLIYTMNVNEAGLAVRNYKMVMSGMEGAIQRTLSGGKAVETLYVTDTCQFDDYAKYEITAFDGKLKAKHQAEEFPQDIQKAFALGASLITGKV
jgi:multimeric flavodoxin WrbA